MDIAGYLVLIMAWQFSMAQRLKSKFFNILNYLFAIQQNYDKVTFSSKVIQQKLMLFTKYITNFSTYQFILIFSRDHVKDSQLR